MAKSLSQELSAAVEELDTKLQNIVTDYLYSNGAVHVIQQWLPRPTASGLWWYRTPDRSQVVMTVVDLATESVVVQNRKHGQEFSRWALITTIGDWQAVVPAGLNEIVMRPKPLGMFPTGEFRVPQDGEHWLDWTTLAVTSRPCSHACEIYAPMAERPVKPKSFDSWDVYDKAVRKRAF